MDFAGIRPAPLERRRNIKYWTALLWHFNLFLFNSIIWPSFGNDYLLGDSALITNRKSLRVKNSFYLTTLFSINLNYTWSGYAMSKKHLLVFQILP